MYGSVASQPWCGCEFSGDARSSSLTATTDGHKLTIRWDRGSLVVELYAPIIASEVARAKMRRGILALTMRKLRAAETWPSFDLATHLELRAAAERRAAAARTAVAAAAAVAKPSPLEALRTARLLRDMLPLFAVWLAAPLLSLIDTTAVAVFVGRTGPGAARDAASASASLAALGPATALCDNAMFVCGFLSITTTSLVAAARAEAEAAFTAEAAAAAASANAAEEADVDDIAVVLSGVATRDRAVARGRNAGVAAAVIVGVPLSALLVARGEAALRLVTTAETAVVVPLAYSYVQTRALGVVPQLISNVLCASAIAQRELRLPLAATVAAAIANVVFDAVAIGVLGMGVAGAAAATVAAQAVMVLVLLRGSGMGVVPGLGALHEELHGLIAAGSLDAEHAFDGDLDGPRRKRDTFRARAADVRSFFAQAAPIALSLTGRAATYLMLTVAAAAQSTAGLAAHQVAGALFALVAPCGDAVAQSAQSLLPESRLLDKRRRRAAAVAAAAVAAAEGACRFDITRGGKRVSFSTEVTVVRSGAPAAAAVNTAAAVAPAAPPPSPLALPPPPAAIIALAPPPSSSPEAPRHPPSVTRRLLLQASHDMAHQRCTSSCGPVSPTTKSNGCALTCSSSRWRRHSSQAPPRSAWAHCRCLRGPLFY